tara:strand:- start:1323 stop:1514 length:192 start_codon:yes stop_codon:yes gene_type:complete
LFKITKAAITPGTQPQIVSIKTIIKEPQPRSITDKGGKIIDNKTLKNDINCGGVSKIQILTAQ